MTHIEQRYGPAAEWTTKNPVLHVGEAGHESDTGKWKVGDGTTAWNALPYKTGVDTVAGRTGAVTLGVADVAGAAPLVSPALTGTPTAPTRATGDNTTSIATTAFVKAVLATLVDGAPTLLDNLNEISAAINDDPNFATTMLTALATKAPLASPTFTGDPKAPTPATADDDTSVATTAFVRAALAAYGPRGQLGYAQVTSDQSGFGTVATDRTGLAAAVSVGTGRRVRVTVFTTIQMQTAPNRAVVRIQEGATTLAAGHMDLSTGAHGIFAVSAILSPTAGAHTYKATAYVVAGGSTITSKAAPTEPSYILVEDIGPA